VSVTLGDFSCPLPLTNRPSRNPVAYRVGLGQNMAVITFTPAIKRMVTKSQQKTVANKSSENVIKFEYFGTASITQNFMHEEINL